MPPSSGRRYKNVPVPFWFNDESASAFRTMQMKEDDVLLSSMVKAGTTWVHKILRSILHDFDDDGNSISGSDQENQVGASGQVYPDALPVTRQRQEELIGADSSEELRRRTTFVRDHFGDWTFQDLCDQPSPRLISTHLFGEQFLPQELLREEGGKGRLVIVMRNLKSVMVSNHFFMGEAIDGWLGNEHGPGSFHRFLADDCPNAFGSVFDWIKEQDKVVTLLEKQTKKRVLVVYYEALKENLPAQLDRINNFLDRPPLTVQKRNAVAEACGFSAMKSGGGDLMSVMFRKGSINDWKNHLTEDLWRQFDDVFAKKLGSTRIAGPLRHYQWWDVPGMPEQRREEWTLDTDPRKWQTFERVKLEDGLLVPDRLIIQQSDETQVGGKGEGFVRSPSEFRFTAEEHPVEAGRYHLFASGICPWANSVTTAVHLLGLQDVISMDISDGQSGAGWTFLDGASCSPWRGREGPFWLHEVYQLHGPLVTTRITVPVLWDTKANRVVSNDSWTIIKFLSTAFAGMGTPSSDILKVLPTNRAGHPTLLPDSEESANKIETLHADIYSNLLNGVYMAGLGLMRNDERAVDVVLEARRAVYDKLEELNELLSKHRFLTGANLTAVDVRLAMTLFRWDCSYRNAFALDEGRGGILLGNGYPSLKAFLRDFYSLAGETIDFVAIRQYYRIRPALVKAFKRSKGEKYEEIAKGDLKPLPDLRAILSSAQEPVGNRS